ncbi:MAG: YggT family protein [Actinomycetota bacterium]|nr:YggT family protein [Actinomycetota bacterium]
MNIVWQIAYLLLWIFRLLILGRIVIELVRAIAKTWRPVGRSAATMEVLYATTDPPVKLFRRVIPPLRLGGVGFDLSIIVLFIVVAILMGVTLHLADITA